MRAWSLSVLLGGDWPVPATPARHWPRGGYPLGSPPYPSLDTPTSFLATRSSAVRGDPLIDQLGGHPPGLVIGVVERVEGAHRPGRKALQRLLDHGGDVEEPQPAV